MSLAVAAFAVALAAAGAEKPLSVLPYTPALDLAAMDRTADPCVDFYAYSCAGWQKANPIPADQASWDVYGKMAVDNLRLLWGILDTVAKPDDKRTAVQRQVGDYFAACMDEAAVEKRGAAPLAETLAAIDALKTPAALARFLGRQHLASPDAGLSFGFGSSQDYDDATRTIAFASAGGLGLPDRDYYVNDDGKSKETRAKYEAHVAGTLALLGDEPKKAAAEAKAILALETALAKASLTRVEKRDPYHLKHRLSLAELQKLTPAFPWADYLAAGELPRYDLVNVTEPKFFEALAKELSTRDFADWRAYLRWHVARAAAPYLSKAFVEPAFVFYRKYLRGVTEEEPRWKRCVQYVDRDLGEALGQVFVERVFSADTKAVALKMTLAVEGAMEDDLKSLPWMSEKTREQALRKLHQMRNKIGYPDHWRDYSSIALSRGDFYGDVSRATIFENRRELAKIGKPLDRGEWQMTPPTVNAYYDSQMNDMNFPAGVLLPPLFDLKIDLAPSYGNTGATIGHELTHGFDDEGRQFDADGNLRDWWTKDDAAEFARRASCVSDQYSSYVVVDDLHINGKLTLGEDVADLGGTALAYRAWKKAMAGQKLEPRDSLSPEQRFFVGMAQWACGSTRPEEERLRAVTNPHSPLRYRINGVVANLPEFKSAFSCKAGQPMVREPPCRVW